MIESRKKKREKRERERERNPLCVADDGSFSGETVGSDLRAKGRVIRSHYGIPIKTPSRTTVSAVSDDFRLEMKIRAECENGVTMTVSLISYCRWSLQLAHA